MRIYRVERKFITLTNYGWNKEPRSPYGWSGTDNSEETYLFLDKHGIIPGNFTHIHGNVGIPHRPAAGKDPQLMASIQNYFGAPVDQLPKKWNKEFYFGFESVEHFYRWFDDDDLYELRDKGYYIAVYEVCDNSVLLGLTQLMYKLSDATQVDFILI